jgi:hypothetical protein
MRKLSITACLLLLASAAPGWSEANMAQPQMTPLKDVAPSVSVFSAPTVNDFLVACRTDQGGCVDEVGSALMDKFQYQGDICLPAVDYASAVPGWLASHNETHAMPTEDGIYIALKALYPCG